MDTLTNGASTRINGFTLTLVCLCQIMAVAYAERPAAQAPSRSASQEAAPLIQAPECPTLPGCPDGAPVPLPPGVQTEIPAEELKDQAGGVPKEFRIYSGSGKYAGMILIPSGAFIMGSDAASARPDEKPGRQVYLKPYYIAKREVTADQYCTFLNKVGIKRKDKTLRADPTNPACPIHWNGSAFEPKPGLQNAPMVCVSWYGASDYAKWSGGRLPTAAEWEKAAMLTTPEPPGDFLRFLNRERSSPVQISKPGKYGMSGMIDNVWEWVSDWYDRDYYADNHVTNPLGPPLGFEKEIRGGSWASALCSTRITNRHKAPPQGFYRSVGFRIVKDAK